jgi:hypothetical protein
MSHWPVAETSTSQHSQETDIHAPGGIRTRNSSMPAAVGPRLKHRCRCNLQNILLV